MAALHQGDPAAAEEHARRAVTAAHDAGDWKARIESRNQLGLVLEALGRPEDALAQYTESALLSERAGYEPGALAANLNLARIRFALGDDEGAAAALERAAGAARAVGTRLARADLQRGRAVAALRGNRPADAARCAREAARLYELLPASPALLPAAADAHLLLGRGLAASGKRVEAVPQFREARDLARAAGDPALTATAIEGIAETLFDLDHPEDGLLHLEQAVAIRREVGPAAYLRADLERMAEVASQVGRHEQARRCADELERLGRSDAGAALGERQADPRT